MKTFVKVRNCVTTSDTLPGIAVTGITKLICETTTIAAHGK